VKHNARLGQVYRSSRQVSTQGKGTGQKGLEAYHYIKADVDKHIRFEDNFLARFYKKKNLTDKFDASSDNPMHFRVVIGITSYQGDL
jgi:hypothetical protein